MRLAALPFVSGPSPTASDGPGSYYMRQCCGTVQFNCFVGHEWGPGARCGRQNGSVRVEAHKLPETLHGYGRAENFSSSRSDVRCTPVESALGNNPFAPTAASALPAHRIEVTGD